MRTFCFTAASDLIPITVIFAFLSDPARSMAEWVLLAFLLVGAFPRLLRVVNTGHNLAVALRQMCSSSLAMNLTEREVRDFVVASSVSFSNIMRLQASMCVVAGLFLVQQLPLQPMWLVLGLGLFVLSLYGANVAFIDDEDLAMSAQHHTLLTFGVAIGVYLWPILPILAIFFFFAGRRSIERHVHILVPQEPL